MVRKMLVVLSIAAVTAGSAGCGRDAAPAPAAVPSTQETSPAATEFGTALRDKVTVDAMMGHLTDLQEIADAHGGNRALGTPGYDASVDYVANALRDKGFDVQTPEFEVRLPFAEEPQLTVGGRNIEAKPLEYTIGTAPQGVSGPLVPARVEDSPGCTATDYDGLPVQGAVVLVDRGECPFSVKQTIAAERGAVAMVVVNNVDGDVVNGTLGDETDVKIPAVSVTKAVGTELRDAPGETTLRLNAGVREERTRNVIAQTKTGSTADVVMVGAHLDSVPEGPGINDNGSGVAAVLETALQLGAEPDVRNAVRFGFWGAEEEGLLGSSDYTQSLDEEQLKDIALYLNFDMLGSPNPGYFTYDGDQSTPPNPEAGTPRVPEGSAGIERTLARYLADAGKPAEDTSFDGRSDYDGFTLAGIPAGGLFSGAEEKKTPEQAERWGGEADAPFDPNYHKKEDNLGHIDRTAMEINGGGVAFAVGLYAQDQRGRNGIPLRDDRTRHPAGA
ncbi:M28 family metallopeptidase [Mycolicibacterium litorale]|uniref:Hydrolase n=1 Tax=Mycolicibacterium litorale TaxID=758802 RepID=A0AAD1IMS0_9MYCO|nr:M28 family metallopeptidase [Mycolicibacterium litorale]MCV7416793.1 M20/M25/M40 family metallo-hydrolase [Mycolicibacterium litorale]TDY04578.1 aminopeptidase Y [Mycolicibacterium litorale]BBY18004.1 hydrolase [Mycolicibacterium litorale]